MLIRTTKIREFTYSRREKKIINSFGSPTNRKWDTISKKSLSKLDKQQKKIGENINDKINPLKKSIKQKIRQNQVDLDGNLRCPFCFGVLNFKDSHIEHFIPKKKNPEYMFYEKNLILSCASCNLSYKRQKNFFGSGSPTSYDSHTFDIIHPIFDVASSHLKTLNRNSQVIIIPNNGSIKGKKHIEVFELNSRDDLIYNRRSSYFNKLTPAQKRNVRKITRYR